MQCLACGAEMLLMEVVQTDTMTASGIERHTFKCSACRQIAQRLMFSRARMPIINLPAVTHPEAPAIKPPMGRVAWATAVEKLSSRQTALKERAAAARTSAWANAVEKLRSRQAALKE
jgi:hypothetical protein